MNMDCPICKVPMREHAEEGHGRRWDLIDREKMPPKKETRS